MYIHIFYTKIGQNIYIFLKDTMKLGVTDVEITFFNFYFITYLVLLFLFLFIYNSASITVFDIVVNIMLEPNICKIYFISKILIGGIHYMECRIYSKISINT